MNAFISLLKRFRSDERGIFAVIFGVMALVLVALAGAAVDYTSMETARTRAQIALDAAALGLGPKIYDDDVTEDQLVSEAQAVVSEQLANVPQVTVDVSSADVDQDNGTLRLSGSITVPMAFVQLVGIQNLTAGITSEVTKGSINLEVALAIDITKSMEDTRNLPQISVLETATQDLIGAVVKEDQEPTYSKMAVIPWSMGVNVGDYADTVRGQPLPAKNFNTTAGSYWVAQSGAISGTITGITKANPGVVTSANHGLVTGDRIVITGIRGMTQINNPQASNLNSGNKGYRVVKIDNNKFSLQVFSSGAAVNTNSNSYSNYSNTGTWRRCALTTCEVTVNANAHGFANNDWIVTTDVNGLSGLNNKAWQVKDKTNNALVLKDSFGNDYGTTWTSGGKLWCTLNPVASRPCEFYRYQAVDGSYRTDRITTCVTERATNRYTNDPVSTTWLGRHFPDGNSLNACIGNEIVPLTSDKDTLLADTDDLVAAGSTAGHIGLAWAWYLLSHDFTNHLFSATPDSIAADPDAPNAEPVMKVVVLMTDGLFNTNYCDSVVAKNADSVAGSNSQRRNCDGVNSTTQGAELCDEIEDDGIIIYTVAFALQEIADEDDRDTVRQMLADCATANGGAYEATNGQDLLDAFEDIGRNITDLRLSL